MNDESSMFCSATIKKIVEQIKSKTEHDEYNLSRCTGYVTHKILPSAHVFEMHCHMDCCSKVWVYLVIENNTEPIIPLGTYIINRTAFTVNDINLIDSHVAQVLNSYKRAISLR